MLINDFTPLSLAFFLFDDAAIFPCHSFLRGASVLENFEHAYVRFGNECMRSPRATSRHRFQTQLVLEFVYVQILQEAGFSAAEIQFEWCVTRRFTG